MSIYLTLYNNGNALIVMDKGDYVELLSINDKPIKAPASGSPCRWWQRGGVRYMGRLYKPVSD